MSSKRLRLNNALNKKSVNTLIKNLESYRDETIRQCCRAFVSMLADEGIQIANMTKGSYASSNPDDINMADYIYFYKEVHEPTISGCKAILIGTSTMDVYGQGVGAYAVSPILMEEFGSGAFAGPVKGSTNWLKSSDFSADASLNPVGGKGTHPNQSYANNPNGWWWVDVNGEKHHSYGYVGSHPMQRAADDMSQKIKSIGRQAFGSISLSSRG